MPISRSTRRSALQCEVVLITPYVTSSPIFDTVGSWNRSLDRPAIENIRENFEDKPEEDFPKAQRGSLLEGIDTESRQAEHSTER